MKTRKIKVIVFEIEYGDHDDFYRALFGTDWDEVDDEKYKEIVESVVFLNFHRYYFDAGYHNKKFLIVEEVGQESLFKTVKELKVLVAAKKKEEAAKKEEADKKREAARLKKAEKSRAQKLLQLEKLRKELDLQ